LCFIEFLFLALRPLGPSRCLLLRLASGLR
jgi:hypothetical protein